MRISSIYCWDKFYNLPAPLLFKKIVHKLKATIYSHKTVIGTADLQTGDESMGCVFGHFIPNDFYVMKIQKLVWEFWATNKPDYQKWHSLRFNAQLDNGYFLFPLGGYTIEDVPDLPDEPKRIDIARINLDIFNLPAGKLLEPWTVIDIEQKLSFEDELKNEITSTKFFLGSLSSKGNHVLLGAEFSAFAKYGPKDDVLFEIAKEEELSRFAIVHLTWVSRNKEHSSDFPATQFYIDFEDFTERRMKPDFAEWNK